MIVSVAAGVLLMIGTILTLTGPHAKVNELTLGLITDHRRQTLDLVSEIIDALADIAIGWTLVFMYRCARGRNVAGRALPFIPVLAVIGTALAAIAGIADAIVVAQKVNEFISTGSQTYDEANRLTSGSLLLVLQILEQLASLLIAISFVLVSLAAMRVGLVPRFLGYVGMVAGALVLFPIISVPVVQLYFLVCLGLLMIGRWPGGALKAWQTGQAEAWPSSAEMRARRAEQAEVGRQQRAERKAAASQRRRRTRDLPDVVKSPAASDSNGSSDADADGAADSEDASDGGSTKTGGASRPAGASSSQRRKRKHRR
jgi:hypothetical protein